MKPLSVNMLAVRFILIGIGFSVLVDAGFWSLSMLNRYDTSSSRKSMVETNQRAMFVTSARESERARERELLHRSRFVVSYLWQCDEQQPALILLVLQIDRPAKQGIQPCL